jgi:hypothetical protein
MVLGFICVATFINDIFNIGTYGIVMDVWKILGMIRYRYIKVKHLFLHFGHVMPWINPIFVIFGLLHTSWVQRVLCKCLGVC